MVLEVQTTSFYTHPAFIAFVTSILTLLVTNVVKNVYERKFHIFKLEKEYQYEQRKKLKDVLSVYKSHLINSFESFNHRLWNFSHNYIEPWMIKGEDFFNKRSYYFRSFIYRTLALFAWIRILESKLIYLDTTISTKEDMEFLKFLKLFPEVFCEYHLFDGTGYTYKDGHPTDHFYRNDFDEMTSVLIEGDNVMQFSAFEDKLKKLEPKIRRLCNFYDGLSPLNDRLNWDRLQAFHICLLAFLNSFGYDYQYTNEKKLKDLFNRTRKSKVIHNLIDLLKRYKLQDQRQIKNILRGFEKSHGAEGG